jgi:hypothetical protein
MVVMILRRSSSFLVGILLLLCGSLSDAGSAEEVLARGQIWATYDVDLAGFNLGQARFRARFQGSTYQLQGKGRFSLLAGQLYSGAGNTTSNGKLAKTEPEPSFFTLSYEGGGKREQRRMSFANGAVSQVSIAPQKRQCRRCAPVTKEQLIGVLDPLSAVFLYPRPDNSPGDVCNRTLPIFDGRMRFDVALTPKRTDRLLTSAPTGLSETAAVCQVKFVPIAGHRPDKPGIKFMSQTNEIEVWFIPLPQSTMYLPYRIVVPTPLGRGSVTLTEIKMRVDGGSSHTDE